jgi:hypothetical protein
MSVCVDCGRVVPDPEARLWLVCTKCCRRAKTAHLPVLSVRYLYMSVFLSAPGANGTAEQVETEICMLGVPLGSGESVLAQVDKRLSFPAGA